MNATTTAKPSVRQLTANGRGAVASLVYEGDVILFGDPSTAVPALFVAANGKPLAEQPVNRIVFGLWGVSNREDIVVCRTSELTLEIHCHGGHAAVRRILDDLRSRGVELSAETLSVAGSDSVGSDAVGGSRFDNEMTAALTSAKTLRAATIIQRQRNGNLRLALEQLVGLDDADELRDGLSVLVARSQFGVKLSQVWNVVVVGRPNVGKSSLINALVGFERSIVFDQPGTTRDVVSVETAIDGWPIALSDTAGMRANADALESAGIDRAKELLDQADLQIVLLDVSQPAHSDDDQLLENYPQAIVVTHKVDLPQVNSAVSSTSIAVSSVTKVGLEELMRAITTALIPDEPAVHEAIPVTDRQVGLLNQALECAACGDVSSARQHVQAILQ